MKKTVIIGGSGFIGTNLIPHLIENGREVVVIDKYKSDHPALKEVEFIEMDCKDNDLIAPLVNDADEIIYLAYSSTPATSEQAEINEYEQNVQPVISLLECLKSGKISKFIFLSTGGAIYGNVADTPITELQPPRPISAYGKSKLEIEKQGLRYFRECGLPFISLRPSNVYGPGQVPFRGQGLIATAFGCACENKTLRIFGKDVVRDYVYIDDLCDALVLALETAKTGEVYNIGTGRGISNSEVISRICDLVATDNYELRSATDTVRDFDPLCNVLDSSKFKHVSNWSSHTPFPIGLKNTWEWVKKYYAK